VVLALVIMISKAVVNHIIHLVSEKNWTLRYFIIYLLSQLQIARIFPQVHRTCWLLWIWSKFCASL